MLQKVCAGPTLERSISPGEIAVFEPTGEAVDTLEDYETTTGIKQRKVSALVYHRTRTRLVEVLTTRTSG